MGAWSQEIYGDWHEDKSKLETTGNYPHPMTPAELLAFIRSEQQMWKPVLEQIARNP